MINYQFFLFGINILKYIHRNSRVTSSSEPDIHRQISKSTMISDQFILEPLLTLAKMVTMQLLFQLQSLLVIIIFKIHDLIIDISFFHP